MVVVAASPWIAVYAVAVAAELFGFYFGNVPEVC